MPVLAEPKNCGLENQFTESIAVNYKILNLLQNGRFASIVPASGNEVTVNESGNNTQASQQCTSSATASLNTSVSVQAEAVQPSTLKNRPIGGILMELYKKGWFKNLGNRLADCYAAFSVQLDLTPQDRFCFNKAVAFVGQHLDRRA